MENDFQNFMQNGDFQRLINYQARTFAPQGYYFNNTTGITGVRTGLKLSGLILLEDVEFSALEVDGVNVLSTYNFLGNVIPKELGILFAPGTRQITAYTLSSGSVIEIIEED